MKEMTIVLPLSFKCTVQTPMDQATSQCLQNLSRFFSCFLALKIDKNRVWCKNEITKVIENDEEYLKSGNKPNFAYCSQSKKRVKSQIH